MEDTLEGGSRPVNKTSVETLLLELTELVRLLKPIAERANNTPDLFTRTAQPQQTKSIDTGLEAQAVVLASTMDRPNLNKIARALGVARSTAQRWRHLQAALERVNRPSREVRRGVVNSDGDPDGVE